MRAIRRSLVTVATMIGLTLQVGAPEASGEEMLADYRVSLTSPAEEDTALASGILLFVAGAYPDQTQTTGPGSDGTTAVTTVQADSESRDLTLHTGGQQTREQQALAVQSVRQQAPAQVIGPGTLVLAGAGLLTLVVVAGIRSRRPGDNRKRPTRGSRRPVPVRPPPRCRPTDLPAV